MFKGIVQISDEKGFPKENGAPQGTGGLMKIAVFVLLLCGLAGIVNGRSWSWFSSLASSVLRPRRKVTPKLIREEDLTNVLDKFGDLPQLRVAMQAIDQARPISVVRTLNSTVLVSFVSDIGDRLHVPIGIQPFHLIDKQSGIHVLVTGIAGDCRVFVRTAKNLTIDHFQWFDGPPSARYLAHKLGDFLQRAMQQHRTLACHGYVIQPAGARQRAAVYEVSPSGGVQEVTAGIAGNGSLAHRQHLEQACDWVVDRANISLPLIEEAHAIVDRIFAHVNASDHQIVRKFELHPMNFSTTH